MGAVLFFSPFLTDQKPSSGSSGVTGGVSSTGLESLSLLLQGAAGQMNACPWELAKDGTIDQEGGGAGVGGQTLALCRALLSACNTKSDRYPIRPLDS